MSLIAYHASQEQFSPSDLLNYVQQAEKIGFTAIHSSDHFHPWSTKQGESGFTFSWIAAAMQACSLPFSMVCAPGQRFHPAIVAQAIATIDNLFPGRLTVELGSGEALNESITGEPWPEKPLRNERLLQSKHVISSLLAGKKVNFKGHIVVKNAKLYTLPETSPSLFVAALSDETAEWAGTFADGLLTTVDNDTDVTRSKLELFYKNGGKGKPVHLQYAFCYARTRDQAIEQAFHQWRSNMVGMDELANLPEPEDFDRATEQISREEVAEKMNIITDLDELKHRIEDIRKLQPACIHLHNVSCDQETYLQDMARIFPL